MWNPAPWEIEAELIRELRPPLNLAENSHHPFFEQLSQIRKEATSRTHSMEALLTNGPKMAANVVRELKRSNVAQENVMPFKSQAQRRKFAQLLVEGKISNQTFEEWNRETGAKRLPERVRRSAKSATKASAKPRARRKATKRKAAKKR